MWCRCALLVCVAALVSPAFGGIFDFSEFDDPLSTLGAINRNTVWWRNTYGIPCNVRQGNTDESYGVCKSSLECKSGGGRILGRGTCNLQQCCSYSGFCNSITSKKVSYFRSPTTFDWNEACQFTVKVYSPHVCQMRLDFEEFQLSRTMQTGTEAHKCAYDSLHVETPNDFVPPTLCDYNTGQHMYINVNASNNELSMKLKVNLYDRSLANQQQQAFIEQNPRWRIRITQLECPTRNYNFKQLPTENVNLDFWNLAPPGCLQYFAERTGLVRSFGYNPGVPLANNRYIGGLNYGICFRRTSSTCGMRLIGRHFSLATGCDAHTPANPLDYLFIPEGRYTFVPATGAAPDPAFQDVYCTTQLDPDVNPQATVQSNLPTPLYMHFFSDNNAADPAIENGFELRFEVPPAGNCQ